MKVDFTARISAKTLTPMDINVESVEESAKSPPRDIASSIPIHHPVFVASISQPHQSCYVLSTRDSVISNGDYVMHSIA